MAIISKQEQQPNGNWWTWAILEGNDTLILDTLMPITESEAQTIVDLHSQLHQYDSVPQVHIDVYEHKPMLVEAITYIKTSNPTLTQWNNYLASLSWEDSLLVRWFLATLARELANRSEVDLATFTETEVLAKLKVWISNAPPRRLEKVLFGG